MILCSSFFFFYEPNQVDLVLVLAEAPFALLQCCFSSCLDGVAYLGRVVDADVPPQTVSRNPVGGWMAQRLDSGILDF